MERRWFFEGINEKNQKTNQFQKGNYTNTK